MITEDGPPPERSVCFADPSNIDAPPSLNPAASLVSDLFGSIKSSATTSSWNVTVLDSIQAESRGGLSDDLRSKLLAKYETKGELAKLAPPKLNKELLSALTPSVIKRDEYQSLLQAQVTACLNAFGSGISILLKPEIFPGLHDEAQSALTFFAEGIHLLADHHYRLSLTRRAFTKPSLNILGKNAAETAPVDDFLFGQNFAETLRAAQACERAGRDVSKSSAPSGKKTLQPVRRGTVSQTAPPSRLRSQIVGNRKAPVRPESARRAGASQFASLRRRSQSRSRFHRHH